MRHSEIKCWPDPFDAIVAGRKRADVRRADRDYQVGDSVELVRWDPDTNERSIGRAEILITHVDRAAGPLLIYGMEAPEARRPPDPVARAVHFHVRAPTYHPLVVLSFVFIRAEYPYPPQEQSEQCRTGDTTDELTPVPDRP